MENMINSPATGCSLFFQMMPGVMLPYEYGGVKFESTAYNATAWIGTTLMISPIYDVYGPDAVKFMNSVCTNNFTNLSMTGLRHAVICNEEGLVLTDGVAFKVAEDRIRTYWLNPPLQYFVETSEMDVHGEDMTGREYFIQVQGEKSLEILEDALKADLHDIKFPSHRFQNVDGRQVNVVRLGMTGNLAYEIHGDMADFEYIYDRVAKSGEKFGARKQGMHTCNLFNHTEAGFPNINLHYPLPWFESGDGLANFLYQHPQMAFYNIARILEGSMGDNLQDRFVTPYDIGLGSLVKFNHDFRGKEALMEIAKAPRRQPVTLEWNAEDVGSVYAAMLSKGSEEIDDITIPGDSIFYRGDQFGFTYRADKVLNGEQEIGFSSGRIHSYTHHSMISLGFIAPEFAQEGTELTVIWGTPGTKQMKVRVKVACFPYNKNDIVSNKDKNVEEIPHPQF